MRREPFLLKCVTSLTQILYDVFPVQLNEIRKQEAVMQRSSPPHQFASVRIPPEERDQRSYQQLLCETHARVRRHLERARLHQANPARSVFSRIKLINTPVITMAITCQIGQKVTEYPKDEQRTKGRGGHNHNQYE